MPGRVTALPLLRTERGRNLSPSSGRPLTNDRNVLPKGNELGDHDGIERHLDQLRLVSTSMEYQANQQVWNRVQLSTRARGFCNARPGMREAILRYGRCNFNCE